MTEIDCINFFFWVGGGGRCWIAHSLGQGDFLSAPDIISSTSIIEWKINFAPLSLTCLNVKCKLRICLYTSFIHVFFISPQILSSCQFVVVFINLCARCWCFLFFFIVFFFFFFSKWFLFEWWHARVSSAACGYGVWKNPYRLAIRMVHTDCWFA